MLHLGVFSETPSDSAGSRRVVHPILRKATFRRMDRRLCTWASLVLHFLLTLSACNTAACSPRQGWPCKPAAHLTGNTASAVSSPGRHNELDSGLLWEEGRDRRHCDGPNPSTDPIDIQQSRHRNAYEKPSQPVALHMPSAHLWGLIRTAKWLHGSGGFLKYSPKTVFSTKCLRIAADSKESDGELHDGPGLGVRWAVGNGYRWMVD